MQRFYSLLRKACFVAFLFPAQSVDVLLQEAQASYARQEYAAAEESLRRAIRIASDSFDAHFLLGACLLQQGNSIEAIYAWRRAHAIQPAHVSVIKLLAIQYLQGNYFREAIELLRPAVGQFPDDVELHLFLIQALHNAMDYVPALEAARHARERFPDHPRVNLELGIQLYSQGAFDESRDFFQKSLGMDPSEATARYYLGDLLLKEGKYEQAVKYLRDTIAGQPENLDAYIGLSKAFTFLEKLDEAIDILNDAINVNPNDSRIYMQLSQLYERKGDHRMSALQAKIFQDVREQERGKHEMTGGRSLPKLSQSPE